MYFCYYNTNKEQIEISFMPSFHLGPFGFKTTRPNSIYLKTNDTVIVSYWSWKKFGWQQKQYRTDKNGDLEVTNL